MLLVRKRAAKALNNSVILPTECAACFERLPKNGPERRFPNIEEPHDSKFPGHSQKTVLLTVSGTTSEPQWGAGLDSMELPQRNEALFCLFEFDWGMIVKSCLQRFLCLVVASTLLTSSALGQLPDPDGQPASQDKKVKVYILLGQSNMLGFGRVGPADVQGSLEHMVKEQGKYPFMVDDEGNWTVRKDVRYVHAMDKRGVPYDNLEEFAVLKNDWLSVKGNFGPELGFGHVMGHFHDEPVLVLKACIGNRSLGWDLLPPGSERYEFEGRTYAGYKDNPGSWVEGEPKKEVGWYAGRQYDADTSHAKIVLENLKDYYPEYADQGYEVAGFVFWQGHKDQNAAHASRYEQNLVHFINSLRKDFEAPEAKFVLASIAFGGDKLSGHGLTVCNAQLAVDGDSGKYPEFEGNVNAIDARPFWREADVSPKNQGYHYNHNAETYMEVGLALGEAMVELLK